MDFSLEHNIDLPHASKVFRKMKDCENDCTQGLGINVM